MHAIIVTMWILSAGNSVMAASPTRKECETERHELVVRGLSAECHRLRARVDPDHPKSEPDLQVDNWGAPDWNVFPTH